MGKNRIRVFLDTSVIFSAVLSHTGGARKLFLLGELGILELVTGPTALVECEAVVRRKMPESLPGLALLIELGGVEITERANRTHKAQADEIAAYLPDARVLAEAIGAQVDWFITHDKTHFLKLNHPDLPFRIGTPGDLIQALGEDLASGQSKAEH